MPVTISNTPNPNALKFTVNVPVGGPSTFVPGTEVGDPTAAALLAIEGVTSVFLSADFVTLSKRADASWESITPRAVEILEARFGA